VAQEVVASTRLAVVVVVRGLQVMALARLLQQVATEVSVAVVLEALVLVQMAEAAMEYFIFSIRMEIL
jgi:hypothetical protein